MRDGREGKDNRDLKMNKDNRDSKESREGRDSRDFKNSRDRWNSYGGRDRRDTRDGGDISAAGTGRDGWSRQNQQSGIMQPFSRNISRIKVEETIDDIKGDINRLEKEIALEINEIKSLRLGL